MTTTSSSSSSSPSFTSTMPGQFSDHSQYLHHYHHSGMTSSSQLNRNEYDRFFKNYIHNQNFKIKVNNHNHKYQNQKDNNNSNRCFIKLQEHVMYKNKAYDINNCFELWIGGMRIKNNQNKKQKQVITDNSGNNSNSNNNVNSNNTQNINDVQVKQSPFIMGRSFYFKSCKNLLNFHYRFQNMSFKGFNFNFNFNPYLVIDFDKQQRQLQFRPHFAVGIIHKSQFINLMIHAPLFQNKITFKSLLEYNKDKLNVQLSSQWDLFTAHLKIDRLFSGYKLTDNDYVCANMKVDQFFSLFKFKKSHTNHKISIAYIRRVMDNLKFGVQLKSINGFDHRLNFGIEFNSNKVVRNKNSQNNDKKQSVNNGNDQKSDKSVSSNQTQQDISLLPINIKAKIDTNLNTYFMIRYPLSIFSNFFQTSYLSYGFGFSSVFNKNKKLQQGISIECNI